MNRKIVGLDIRPDAVAAVVLRGGLRDRTVEHATLEPRAGSNGDGLKAALERIRERIDLDGTPCVAAFPPGRISYRNLSVPFSNAKKIGQILPFEIEPTLPYPVEDLVLDFHSLRPNGENGADIFALAVEKEGLADYLATLKSVGIDPYRVTAGGYSAALCAAPDGDEAAREPFLVLDAGIEAATLFLVSDGEVQLARSTPLRPDAPPTADLLARIVRQTRTAYEDRLPETAAPARMYLTGAGLREDADTLAATLTERLGLPVRRLDLMANGNGRLAADPAVRWSPGDMNGALALALVEFDGKNGLNLRRGTFATRRDWSAHRKTFVTGGIFLALVLALLGLNLYLDTFALRTRLDRIDAEIHEIFRTTFPDVQRIVDPLHQMRTAMDALESPLPAASDGAVMRHIDLLETISGRIPESIDVIFTRTVLAPDSVLISGDTDTFNAVDEIQNRLDALPLFEKVTIVSTAKDANTNRIRFRIKADL
jgi:general secretion pathway protein L